MPQNAPPTRPALARGIAPAILGILLGFATTGRAEGPGWELAVGSAAAAPGRTAEIPIELSTPEARVSAIAFVIRFDAERLLLDPDSAAGSRVELAVPGEFTASSWAGSEAGLLGIAIYDPTPPIGALSEGEIARLRFRVRPGAAGFAPVRIDPVQPFAASDAEGRAVEGRVVGEGGIAIASARASLTLSRPVVHFGSVPVGSTATQTLVATNSGTAPLGLERPELEAGSAAFGARAPLPAVLQPGESVAVDLLFDAAERGEYSGRLILRVEGGVTATAELIGAATRGEFYYDRRAIVPAVARLDGAESSRWLSELHLHNPGNAEASVRMSLLPNGGASAFGPVEVAIAPGTTIGWGDLIGELFGPGDAGGALLIEASSGDLVIRSSTYNLRADGGRVAQAVPVIELPRLFHSGETAYLTGLEVAERGRTNVTVMNPGERAASLRVEVLDSSGTVVKTRDVNLAPGRIESNLPLFDGLDEAGGLTVRVSATSEHASFFTYASTVDRISGAPLFQSPR
ncbi:MAG TPA: choice-of-anchor D domain-containing protein [Thermoanaerobaculia bacterium]|nr:choice-of-anchor D domain-containing protein [Thermoanaerobaculia bacterium]